METDVYQTIAAPSTGEFKDRGSKFIAYAFPLASEDDWQTHLETVKKEHPKARHHCYAWRFGHDGNQYRANDDGEPSGTAGRPILGQIDSFGLTNVLVVVVRYFGGTLLGTSGLINAYRASTQEALAQSDIEERRIEDVFKIAFDYAVMGDVMNAVKKLATAEVLQHVFEEAPFLEIAIRKTEVQAALINLKAHVAKVSLEEAAFMELVPGLTITFLYTR